ncbi:MAG: Carbon-nitrogen hydrolase [Microbacteriaceae bacterium]|nr:Carbon-nitrogen hydrolase [Microbacteriaceae bacterium]HEV7956256.1 nitrilase-related carbon-nitrogen hydrolase [Marisediminicola sp.]
MLTIALLQAVGVVDAVADNLEKLEMYARRAAAGGADLLVTPELFPTGYAPAVVVDSDGEAVRAELSRIARDQRIAVVGSSVERAGSTRHITASFFDDQGTERTRYRKAHLFGPDEKSVFRPGDDLPELIPYLDLTVALGLCYDIEFPEYARSATQRGADLLCIPTAVPATGDVGGAGAELTYNAERISTLMVPTRALENGVYVAYANHTAPEFTGLSSIASPYGTFLAKAGADEELLTAHVDEAEVRRAREVNTYLTCARPELYRL